MLDGEVHEGLPQPSINEGPPVKEESGKNSSPPERLSPNPNDQDQAAIAELEKNIKALGEGKLPEGLEVDKQLDIQKPERQGFFKGIFEVIKSILRFFGFSINPPQPQEV